MLHNVNMIVGLGFTILPTYLKEKKEENEKNDDSCVNGHFC